MHVGQDDGTPAAARALVGPERIVGRSTHAPEQADAADADPDVDYLAVGPVHATPTKPGRPAAGLDYVAYAARTVGKPWFAIGGLDPATLPVAVEHGARRAVVVRAITEAADPERAAPRCAPRWRCPLGQRSRKRRASAGRARRAGRPRRADGDSMSRGYARSRARADDIRAGLEPLAPGERPLAVTIAAGPRGAARARATSSSTSSGWDVGGSEPTLARRCSLLPSCSASRRSGCGSTATGRCSASRCCSPARSSSPRCSCCVASNWQAVVFCVGVLAVCGPLFWFLIRAMARLQMPSRTR